MTDRNRTAVATHVATERYMKESERGAKTLTQIAAEIGTTKTTVRRWLRCDHWALWMEHWASVQEIWEAGQRDRQQSPRDRAWRIADEQRRDELKVDLDRSLARLLASSGHLAVKHRPKR